METVVFYGLSRGGGGGIVVAKGRDDTLGVFNAKLTIRSNNAAGQIALRLCQIEFSAHCV